MSGWAVLDAQDNLLATDLLWREANELVDELPAETMTFIVPAWELP